MERAKPAADGRMLRSERSRKVIVEAGLALYEQGILVPTAQQVAEQAGVGIRTVFRHFADMEALFVTADELLYQRYQNLFTSRSEGSLQQRIDDLVRVRAEGFETVAPYLMSALSQLWRYEALADNYRKFCHILKKEMLAVLPELADAPREQVDAVEAAVAFETWSRLRLFRGRAASEAAVKLLLESILL